ncbi:hypothetical protein Cst04h_04110 [Corynebacterium striatum]|uniref:Transposase n=1 Tax=Corynebacterium striatum TaxID=43770 RepID=A0ABC9ZJY7_CORST|nr:hypothetical protein Cst04h_04110 [Corynebacterium striatum]
MVVDYLSSQPNRAGYQVSTKKGSGPTHDQMISYIDAYKDQFGARAHLQGSKTGSSWIHHLSWLPQGDHSCSQRKGLKR